MFADANALARQFTHPMLVSSRRWRGTVDVAVGAYVVLNRGGWIVTSAHLFGLAARARSDGVKARALEAKVAALRADASIPPGRRASEIQAIEQTAEPSWITNLSYWPGRDGVTLRDVTVIPAADIAIGRLEPVPSGFVATLPVLKNPARGIEPGRSLCRLGFAFTKVTSNFDADSGSFRVDGEVPYFPLEGMFTRIVDAGRTQDGKYAVRFVETSSPGLRGQSGGPLFDVQGRVWGIQSRTQHLALGFNPEAEIAGRKTQVPQFINLGLAVHVGTILEILDAMGIEHAVSDD